MALCAGPSTFISTQLKASGHHIRAMAANDSGGEDATSWWGS